MLAHAACTRSRTATKCSRSPLSLARVDSRSCRPSALDQARRPMATVARVHSALRAGTCPSSRVVPAAPVARAVPLRLARRARDVTVAVAVESREGLWDVKYSISDVDAEKMKGWKKPIRVAVSGAAGQIANHLLFQLCSGEVFGNDQPIILQLLGSERSREALEGVCMELEDSMYPLLREVQIGIDPFIIFKDADWALLIGAKPRGPGMERADLLDINGKIFVEQGKALDQVAKKTVQVLVVGNPCNTNALICMENAPSIPRKNFHALTRLDENRAKAQLAMRAQRHYNSVTNTAIWGNHSTTQVPDFVNAKIGGRPALEVISDRQWLESEFVPKVATRGGALIKKWGRSSAASTAVSICDAIRALIRPTAPGDVFSSAVISDGNPYGVANGLIFSFPLRMGENGQWEFVKDIVIDDYLRAKIKASEDELAKERDCVGHLIPNQDAAACALVGSEDTWVPGDK